MANNLLSLIFRPFLLPRLPLQGGVRIWMSCTGPVKDALGPTVPSRPSLVSEWNDEEFHKERLVWSILQASAAICNPWSLYLLFLVLLMQLVLLFLSLAAGLSETASHPTSANKAQGILSCFCCMPTGCSLTEVIAFNKMFTLHRETKEAWKFKLHVLCLDVPVHPTQDAECPCQCGGSLLKDLLAILPGWEEQAAASCVWGSRHTSSNWSLQRFQDLNMQHLHTPISVKVSSPSPCPELRRRGVSLQFFLLIRLYRIIGLVAQSCHLAN